MPLFIANLWNWKILSKKIPQKQLLYELSQTVFEYMDPSSRFHLSLHLPSLRSIEKRTPLKINELIFYDNTIFIDKAKYELSIGRKYKRQKPPLRINKTVDYDVDEFGWATNTEDIMMNGDVYMESYSSSTEGTEGLRFEDEEPKKKEQHKLFSLEMLQCITNLWSWKTPSKEVPKTPPKRQLLYESSQTVLEYIEPSFRFHLSLHLPLLRSMEKGSRLHINCLYLTDNAIFIEKTRYQLNIERKYEIEEPPFRINKSIDHDVDEFGFKTDTTDIMINGDVCMENDSTRDEEDEELGDTTVMRKKEIPKCKSTLKLTIKTEYGKPRIYSSSKVTKIYEGMKMLIAALFGNRNVIWNVESMIMTNRNLRWIVSGVKPLVRNIGFGGYIFVNLYGLLSICHPTSFPLKSLCNEMDHRILDHEILVNAEHLTICDGIERLERRSMNHLMRVSNLKVQMFWIPPNLFAYFMNLWLRHRRPVGTSWSFRTEDSEPSDYIDILRGNAQVTELDHRSIKLSMGLSSILSVSYGDPAFHQSININNCTLKMEVLKL
ncbi:unnamed protein product [Caenorhabditis nigoni]